MKFLAMGLAIDYSMLKMFKLSSKMQDVIPREWFIWLSITCYVHNDHILKLIEKFCDIHSLFVVSCTTITNIFVYLMEKYNICVNHA